MKATKILLFILIIVLLFCMIYPFYSITREGLANSFTAVDISNVQQYLDTYNTVTDDGSCATAVKSLKALNFPNTNKIIQSNSDSTNCVIVEKIAALNIKNDKVLQILNTCYGQKYSAVLNMITNIKKTDVYTTNSGFSDYINNASKSPSVSGNGETAASIKSYMDAMGAANQMDSLQNSQSDPTETNETTKPITKK